MTTGGVARATARGGLLDRELVFIAALRRAGLAVSSAETVDATRALGSIDLLDRESLRAALAAATCKRPTHRRTFDSLFDLYFPRRMGAAAAPDDNDEDGDGAADLDAFREQLLQALRDGDEDAIRRIARAAVEQAMRGDTPPGMQAWLGHRLMRDVNPEALIPQLLRDLLGNGELSDFEERVARQTINERLRQLAEEVTAEIRRRLAEERGLGAVERSTVKPLIDQVDFLRASRDDLAELRRQVYPLARRLASRLTSRKKVDEQGRLDFRRTVRASLATGGVPLQTVHKPRKPHKPELVVLCDVSGSVSAFALFTLMLVSALREQFSKVRAFAFIDTCDEITRFFTPDTDLTGAMGRVVREADLVWFDGHSDYGHSFKVFEERFADAITPKTSLLILGDGRNNYRANGGDELRRLAGRARHAYWLNPEPKYEWGHGDSATRAYEELVDDMVECRNIHQLTEFITRLLPV